MNFTLDQIIDVELLQSLQDKLNAINCFPSALIDNSGNILTATAWQDICTKFHRIHPESEKECIASDRYILDHLGEANPAVTYHCPHGMIDNAVPIIVEGRHMANFFTGQLFLEPPNLDYFREQSAAYGFNEDDYLQAVSKVPVWTREQLKQYTDFIKSFTESLAIMGLNRFRESEANRLAAENEMRFRSIIEDTQAGYFFIDKDGFFRDVNDSWLRLYKYDKREEVIGHHFADVQRFEDKEKATAFVERIMDGDPAYLSGEFTRRCRDGSTGYHSFSARPVVREGMAVGMEGFIIDTTRQKLVEMDRDMIRLRLSSVFDKMTEGFALHEIICDRSGQPVDYRFLDINPAFEQMTGRCREEIVGRTALEVFPNLEQSWIRYYGQVALTGEPVNFEDFSIEQKKHFRVVAFSNQKGQFATVFTDITQSRQDEEKVRLLAQAIDSIKECVSMTDPANNITFVNQAFCNTYGYLREELLGKNISLIRSPEERIISTSEILSDTLGDGWSGEVLNRRKDGTDFPAYVSSAVVRSSDDKPVAHIGIAMDISDRKKAEQELISAKDRAMESDRLKSAFLANISHEIRTPMNSILGFSQLLSEMISDQKQIEYLKIVSAAGERLMNIINSVIDIAKIETGPKILSLADIDVNELLNDLFELYKDRNSRIRLVRGAQLSGSFSLHTDRKKLYQILNNLLSNAMKFTKEGFVEFGYKLSSGNIIFYVKDTGIGIPEEYRNLVFERFRKVDLLGRPDSEGAGLGLAITKELTSLLKGEIWFDSKPAGGTTFFIKFPV